MGIHVIKMPDIGEGIAEVELAAWYVKVGDSVTEDQPLADVMTDKATVEIPSPVAGTVVALGGTVGEVLAVGSELIRLEIAGSGNQKPGAAVPVAVPSSTSSSAAAAAEPAPAAAAGTQSGSAARARNEAEGEAPGETVRAASASASGAGHDPAAAPHPHPASGKAAASPVPADSSARSAQGADANTSFVARQAGQRPLASPAVRKRAWDLGIELRFVRGTGPAERVLHEDLDAYLQGSGRTAGASAVRAGYVERNDETQVPVIGLRRKIAQKMQEAKRRIPHFSYVEEIDVTELEDLRTLMNRKWGETRGRLTILPLLARAMAMALRDFPQINARFDDEAGTVTHYGAVHIGIATQSEAGLMVPVLRHVEARDLWSIAAEIARLAQAVRSGKAGRDELSGSTITITSLGPLGGIVTTPVINHPEVGIVGVNRIVERPMFRNGAVVPRKLMNLSSSFDHRVVDGMHAAEFIQAVRALLEQPAMLFVE